MPACAVSRIALDDFFRAQLTPDRFPDYGPNGLQIEGCPEISRLAFAVSATAESIGQAVAWNADALVVHHGLFWEFHGVRTLTGAFGRRVQDIVRADLNLWGFHLPLDAHLELGNAAGLARRLGLTSLAPFAERKGAPLGVQGQWPEAIPVALAASRIEQVCDHKVLVSTPSAETHIQSIGIVTGGANRHWQDAHKVGLDAFLTGEMSEHDWHEAKESGITYFAAGHHSTERFGVLDLMKFTQKNFPSLEVVFFDSENPA